jgi:hypothetical protein
MSSAQFHWSPIDTDVIPHHADKVPYGFFLHCILQSPGIKANVFTSTNYFGIVAEE